MGLGWGRGGADQVFVALRGVRVVGGGWVVSQSVCHPHGSALPCHPFTHKCWAEGALLHGGIMRVLHTLLHGLLHGLAQGPSQGLLQGMLHGLTHHETHGLPPMNTCYHLLHSLPPVYYMAYYMAYYMVYCRRRRRILQASASQQD